MDSSRLFLYKNSVVSYLRYGQGKDVLVAFHGYGQTASDFLYFEEVLSKHYTVLAIDFFWHGQSMWREQQDFTEDDLKQIVVGIKAQENLTALKFSICSFSMGARMARALVRSFPHRIHHLIFIAPPTFAFNRFLNFTTNTKLGLFLFQYFIKHQGSLSKWVHRLNKARILNRPVYVFTSKFIGQRNRLQKVFDTWYAQRKLTTDFDAFFALVDHHGIRTTLIAGTLDSITPPKQMAARITKLKNGRVFLLNQHHQLTTPQIRQVLHNLLIEASQS
jgi:pimeloyl-ACP methyl ester carboxylesterase